MSRGTQNPRHHNRDRTVAPDTPQGDDIGLSARQSPDGSPIPGGRQHLVNEAVGYVKPDIPAFRPEFRGMMAHGVPPGPGTAHDRAETMRGPNSTHDARPRHPQDHTPPKPQFPPVPVIVVNDASETRPLRTSSHRRVSVPLSTTAAPNDPVRLCGRNTNRSHILVLNEDQVNAARFSKEFSNLASGAGSVLPAKMTSYQKIETQDELYALADAGGAVIVSVIEIYTRRESEVQ